MSKPITLGEARAKAEKLNALPKKQAEVKADSRKTPKKEPPSLDQSAQDTALATTPSPTTEKPARTRKHPAARLRPSRHTPTETPPAPLTHSVERTADIQREADAAFAIPYEAPFFDFDHACDDPEAELASRELCRRHLLPFIQRFRPKYKAGWVHADICRRFERFLQQVENGEEPRLLLMMPPRSGKLLADETLVPTPQGWKLHGEIVPGDEVFLPSGDPVRVLAVSEKNVADVRVAFSDGSVFYCHENHEWRLFNRMRGEWETIEAGHFLRSTRFGKKKQVMSGARSIYQLPVVEALKFSDTDFTIHPYVLGAWLGDGSAGKPCITGYRNDREIIDKIERLGYRVSAVCEHATTGVLTTYFSGDNASDAGIVVKRRGKVPGRMSQELMALGIFKNKRIPAHYQTLSVDLRLELLAGLIDTDGTTDVKSRISFTTVSLDLASDVMQLCEGLGFRPYMQEVQPTLSSSGIQGNKVCYVVGFQPTMKIPVALKRKCVSRIAKQRRVGLISVERVIEKRQGHCIQVDHQSGLYVVGERLITTHNSEISSRHMAAWVLGQHPDWEIIAASHTASLTMSFSRYLRDLMGSEAYNAVFPDAVLDPSSRAVENWNLTKGGGYLAAGVGTGITGRGAHILLLDDLVKDIEAADSLTIRDNTWEWYISTAYTRLAPGGGVLGLMTWWHDDDWAGRIQQAMESGEGDKFEIVKYPAINETGDEYILPDDSIVEVPLNAPVPPGARMTRPHNTAIHPERYTTEAMLRIKRNAIAAGMKRTWDALYQQNPIPDEGNYFSKEFFRHYSTPPSRRDIYVYQAWDFAISEGKESDFNVGITIGVDHRDSIYVLDMTRFKTSDGNMLIETVVDYAAQWQVDSLGVEDGQIWKALESQFQKVCDEKKFWPSFEILKPLTDKMVRASPLRGRMQAGKVYFDKEAVYWRDIQKEMLHFPAGKHDDIVDSLAWAVRLTLTRSAPQRKDLPPAPKSWKDKLPQFVEGAVVGASHMAS